MPAKGILLPTKMYAHRGLHDDIIPENSLEAFKAAHDGGYGIELDVQYTKDRQIVVFHDDDLRRMCGIDKKLIDFTYDELKSIKLKDSNQVIPLFSDVLEIMGGLPIICEIKPQLGLKNTEICSEIKQAIEKYSGFMCIESFSPYVVGWFKQNAPKIVRGQLAMDEVEKFKGKDKIPFISLKHLLTNFIARPNFIAYRYTDNSLGLRLLRNFTSASMVAWTTKGEAAIKQACDRFDYFIFEKGIENAQIVE